MPKTILFLSFTRNERLFRYHLPIVLEISSTTSLSLEFHDRRNGEARVGDLVKVMLGKTMVSDGHTQGGRREGVVISHHGRREGSKRPKGAIQFVF